MNPIKPIKNDKDYDDALLEIERLWNAPEGTPEADRMEVLVTLVESYERERFPRDKPDPIAVIEFMMEQNNLTRRDLEPMIGDRGRVSDILNKRRRLTLEMIQKLQAGLGIPADVLVQPYAITPQPHRQARP